MRALLLTALVLANAKILLAASLPAAPEVLVAQSMVIAQGTLTAPIKAIETCIASDKHDYVDLQLSSVELLKGAADPVLKIRWFTRPEDYSPSLADIRRLNSKKVLVFLIAIANPSVKGLYFAGYTSEALRVADEGVVRAVRDEIGIQRKLLAEFNRNFPAANEPLYVRIKALIDALTVEKTEGEAFDKLMHLTPEAAPAVIMLMDDRRDLPNPHVSFESSPGGFEGITHYGPQKVVDALSIILPGLAHRNFVSTVNGGSEEERQAAVDGWRIYLSKSKLAQGDGSKVSN
jgi:hypothetical protein